MVGIISGLSLGLVYLFGVMLLSWWSVRNDGYVTFTAAEMVRDHVTGKVSWTGKSVSFEPRQAHYMKVAEVVITLASASLVFVPGVHGIANVPHLGFSLVLLGMTVVYGTTFMAMLSFFYEDFLYIPETYTRLRRSLIYGLGFGELLSFATAYFWLSIAIAKAYAQGVFKT